MLAGLNNPGWRMNVGKTLFAQVMEFVNGLADQASATADNTIRSTQRVANEAVDSLSGSAQKLRNEVAPLINRDGEQASADMAMLREVAAL